MVIQGLNPVYILDEISQFEISQIFRAKNESNKDDWERARLVALYASPQFNTVEPIKFGWDEESVNAKPQKRMDKQQFERLVKAMNLKHGNKTG